MQSNTNTKATKATKATTATAPANPYSAITYKGQGPLTVATLPANLVPTPNVCPPGPALVLLHQAIAAANPGQATQAGFGKATAAYWQFAAAVTALCGGCHVTKGKGYKRTNAYLWQNGGALVPLPAVNGQQPLGSANGQGSHLTAHAYWALGQAYKAHAATQASAQAST